MWAGVAGGLAEYFDLDPALVRLMWVAAAVLSGGLAVPVYILAWIILPRDDRPPVVGSRGWRDWSQEFHSETQRLADEARRVADDARHTQRPTTSSAADEAARSSEPTASSSEQAWWQSERYVERHREHGHHPRTTGIVLVALGVLLLGANAGIFRLIEWHTMWPLIFIGLGVILLARQAGWNR
jgi:phage shock protein PspC (stress-responsive transcriptional regulator)